MKEKAFLKSTAWILFSTVIFVQPITAQTTREILTNAKIVELVRLGLGEEIIAQKIHQSECQCDTSTTALAKLQAAKIPQKIIMAMLDATAGYSDSAPAKNGGSNRDRPATAQPAESGPANPSQRALNSIAEPGIYLFDDGKMTLIEPTVYSGSKAGFLGTIITYGIKKSKIRAVVRGKSANTHVVTRRPEFYFVFSREYGNAGAVMSGIGGYAATSPNEFILISMKIKSNTREATLGEFNSYSTSTGAGDKEIREFSFEKIKPGVYKVIPKVDLENGEYCFHYAGTTAGTKLFDFGVK